jgi:hypothetical protein
MNPNSAKQKPSKRGPMVKRMQRSPASNCSLRGILHSVHIESPPLGVQYKQVLAALLVRLLRYKLLIMAIVAAALALGIMATLAMPKRFTAEAYVRRMSPIGTAAQNYEY